MLARSTFSWAAALLSPHLATLYSPDLEPASWMGAPGSSSQSGSPAPDFCLIECRLPGYAAALSTAAVAERLAVRPVARGGGDADESLFPVMLGYR